MRRIFNHSLLLGIFALALLTACDNDQSYADRLNEERNAVNAYLANHRVVMNIPEDSVFEVGENAPSTASTSTATCICRYSMPATG